MVGIFFSMLLSIIILIIKMVCQFDDKSHTLFYVIYVLCIRKRNPLVYQHSRCCVITGLFGDIQHPPYRLSPHNILHYLKPFQRDELPQENIDVPIA